MLFGAKGSAPNLAQVEPKTFSLLVTGGLQALNASLEHEPGKKVLPSGANLWL